MMIRTKMAVSAALALACAPVAASAATVLFQDNFDAGTSASNYQSFSQDDDTAVEANPADFDTAANFNYDYSTFTWWRDGMALNTKETGTIPSAPRSVGNTTKGLRLDANNLAPNGLAAISVYPIINATNFPNGAPTGDHKLTVDVWMNYNGGHEGGTGSTEWVNLGINQAGGGIGGPLPTVPAGHVTKGGYSVSVNGEHGAGSTVVTGEDYRVYTANTRLGTVQESGYVAPNDGTYGEANGRNQWYKDRFPFTDGTKVLFETPGAIGKNWVTMVLKVEDGIVYHSINGHLISARTDETYNTGNVMLGYADFAGAPAPLETNNGTVPGYDANFGVIDNVLVETVDAAPRPKWNVNSNGLWSDPANWLNGVPNDEEHTADFTNGISGAGKTVTVDADHAVRALVFDNSQPYTLAAGGGKIILDSLTTGIFGTIRSRSGSHVIDAPIDTKRIVWADVAAGSTVAVNGALTATLANKYLKKSGAGTLVLSNGANSWDAGTRVEGGTLRLGGNGAIPNTPIGVAVSAGATLDLDTFNAAVGQINLNGTATTAANLSGAGGTLTIENHLRTTGITNVSGNLSFAPTTGFTGHRELISNGPLTITGNISGAAKLHQYSTGTTGSVTLGGASTYTGATAVRGGTMIITSNAPNGAPGALGNATSAVEVGDSTVTVLAPVNAASTANVAGTFAPGTGTFTGGPATLDGVTLAEGHRILLKNQTAAAANGIYVRNADASWTRVAELDESSELQYGTQVKILAGTTNANRLYYLFDGNQMNTGGQVWGQEIANAALLTGGPVTIGRNVNVLDTVNTGTSTLGGNSAHASTFAGTVTLNRNTTLTAAAGGSVRFSGAINASPTVAITKAGAGEVVVNNVRAAGLTVSAGTLKVADSGGAAGGTSKVASVAVTGTARLDLRDNKLVTQSALGTATQQGEIRTYNGVTGLIQSGFVNGQGDWSGPGIVTSMEAAQGGLVTLGSAIAGEVLPFESNTILWGGQTVSMTDTIVMYTHAGDANLDGAVDGGDYAFIDAYVGSAAADAAYYKGDFNYDGFIDGGDYAYIDVTVGSPTMPASGHGALTAVPEPASLSVIGLGAAALLGRRRRRPC